MVSPRAVKGFSLLEMLVAVTVLSMVIGISTYAYAIFVRQWDGHLGRFDDAQAQYQRLEWLAAALEDTLPYVVRDDEGELGFYFLGRDEGLTLVTMSPIFGVGEPALIRLFREPDEGDAWRLVYEEAPFAGTLLARADRGSAHGIPPPPGHCARLATAGIPLFWLGRPAVSCDGRRTFVV
jgi:prepilin-type N-terminal cleavage/methylation domain-containing protein